MNGWKIVDTMAEDIERAKNPLAKPVRTKNPRLMKERQEDEVCIITGYPHFDRHHVKPVGSGGPDEKWNLCPMVRKLHQEIHQIGTEAFANKYPRFKSWLLANAWEFCEVANKWRRKAQLPNASTL